CCHPSLFPISTAPRASPSTSLRFSHRSRAQTPTIAVPSRCLFSTYSVGCPCHLRRVWRTIPASTCALFSFASQSRLSPPHFLEDGTHYIRVLYLPCCKLSR
ncbi:hypothetical protein B0H14DRAFT_3863672, partial [Mycena olivaceomarginata]